MLKAPPARTNLDWPGLRGIKRYCPTAPLTKDADMKNLKISTRLYGAFAALILLLVGLAGLATLQLSTMRAATVEIADNWLPSVRTANEMDSELLTARMTVLSHVMNTDTAAMEAIDKKAVVDRQKFDQSLKAYERLISGDNERKAYDQLAQQWKQYLEVDDRVLALSRKNENDQARGLVEGESKKLFDTAMETLDKLVKINSEGAEASRAESETTYANARATLLVISMLAIALAVVAALWLVRSCWRHLNSDPPCRSNIDPGRIAEFGISNCG